MNRDILIHVTDDPVVFPSSGMANTKVILYKDVNDRYWQLFPQVNPNIIMPFIITPITEERFNQLREAFK